MSRARLLVVLGLLCWLVAGRVESYGRHDSSTLPCGDLGRGLELAELGPDQMPIIRAEIPAHHAAAKCGFHFGAARYGNPSPNPVVDRLRRLTELLGESSRSTR